MEKRYTVVDVDNNTDSFTNGLTTRNIFPSASESDSPELKLANRHPRIAIIANQNADSLSIDSDQQRLKNNTSTLESVSKYNLLPAQEAANNTARSSLSFNDDEFFRLMESLQELRQNKSTTKRREPRPDLICRITFRPTQRNRSISLRYCYCHMSVMAESISAEIRRTMFQTPF